MYIAMDTSYFLAVAHAWVRSKTVALTFKLQMLTIIRIRSYVMTKYAYFMTMDSQNPD